MDKKDLSGQKFGSLLVLKRDAPIVYANGNTKERWLVKCDCGREYSTSGLHKNVRCRRCFLKEQRTKNTVCGTIWYNIKYGAKIRNFSISKDVTREYLWKLYLKQNGACAISGRKIFLPDSDTSNQDVTASLDRINSSKGYVVGNVQWVHKYINRMKWELSQSRFIEICKLVVKRFKNQ